MANEQVLELTDILTYLPHRPPFLLLDRVIDVQLGKSLTAIKNVTINEWFFQGHFPEEPVMPGVLILESLAQAATVLAFKSVDKTAHDGDLYLFAGIDKARFKRMVRPGDQLKLYVEFVKMRSNFMKVKAIASVDDEIACTAELSTMKMRNDNGDS